MTEGGRTGRQQVQTRNRMPAAIYTISGRCACASTQSGCGFWLLLLLRLLLLLLLRSMMLLRSL